ncbi:MAG: helix-turn-helix transcriptional regulator [Acidimicrobiales bacterium]
MKITSTRDLATAVRGRRQSLGLSQADLATRAGVSRPWLSDVEAGKPTAEIGLVLRLVDALGLRLDLTPENNQNPDEPMTSVDLDALLDEYRKR